MTAIGWINRGGPSGTWGHPAELALPADARGLLLGEGVFETVLVENGQARLLAAHLQRWQAGANVLALATPPGPAQIVPLVQQAVERSGIDSGALRLNWCRGSGVRGLQPATPNADDQQHHLCWLQLSPTQPVFEPAAVILSPTERRSATSLLSRCKTFGYASALVARRQANAAGADDALLASCNGSLCCATAANLLVRNGRRWFTPPLSSGCLPGIMRQRALDLGIADEAQISPGDLQRSSGALLLNSLGCRPISSKPIASRAASDGLGPIAELNPAEAEHFWRRLLDATSA